MLEIHCWGECEDFADSSRRVFREQTGCSRTPFTSCALFVFILESSAMRLCLRRMLTVAMRLMRYSATPLTKVAHPKCWSTADKMLYLLADMNP